MELNDLLKNANERVNDFYELQKLGLILKNGEFFPAGVHYPPITDYPNIEYNEILKNYKMPSDGLLDLYVHFPFCSKRCLFCHYPSQYKNNNEEKDKYINALEKEFDIYIQSLGIDKIKLRVALIGGGTPTDLKPNQLERFLKILTTKCDMTNVKQFNYDVSPHTLIGAEGIERLKILKDYGVDRLTIGIQSMDEKVLKLMNRPHNKAEAIESVENSMNMGFKTNIEFIFGHPGQTVDSWYEELKQIVQIDSHEYQFYRLKIEAYGDQQGTIKDYKSLHEENFPSAEDCIRMKQMIFDYLGTFGIHENLRRVYTRDKSNISLYAYNQCCNLFDQIGLGLTAFSSLRDRFLLNTQSFEQYYERIEQGMLPCNRGLIRNSEELQRWAIILPLKNYFIIKNRFKNVTGLKIEDTRFYKIIQKLKEYDLVEENQSVIKLTQKGIFFADEVVRIFYENQYIPKSIDCFEDGILNPYALNN